MEGSPDSCHPFLCRSLYQFDFLHPISNKRQKFPHNVFPRRHASQRDIWRHRHNYVWKLNRFLFPVVIPVSSVCSNLSGFDISFKKEIPQGKCWKSLKTAIKKSPRNFPKKPWGEIFIFILKLFPQPSKAPSQSPPPKPRRRWPLEFRTRSPCPSPGPTLPPRPHSSPGHTPWQEEHRYSP